MKRHAMSALAAVVIFAILVTTARATTNHTITLDGTNDFASDESLGSEAGRTGYLTWDASNLYIGITGNPIVGTHSNLYVVVDTTAVSNADPRTGAGRSDQPTNESGGATYPFNADVVFLFSGTGSEDSSVQNPAPGKKYTVSGGSWTDANISSGVRIIRKSSTITELEIPFSELGVASDSDFNILFYIANTDSSSGNNFAQWPTGNANGNNPILKDFYTYTRKSGIAPNAGQHYSYREDSTSGYSIGGSTFGSIFFVPPSATTYSAGSLTNLGYHLYVGSNATFSMGSNTAALTVGKNVTIVGTLTLSTNSGGDLNVAGNWTNNGTFNANNRQVKYNGSGTQTVTGATTFDYLDIANTSGGNVTLSSNITVRRELKISSGGTLNAGATTITMQGDNTAAPPFINNGTFNAGTGTVAFSGTGNQNARVVGNSATAFNNVTMTSSDPNASDKRFGVDFYDHDTSKRATINGTLTLNQYTFVATEENGSSTACGSDTCDGTPIYASGSTLKYNNSGTFNSAAEWWPDDGSPACGSEKGLPYNVLIANSTTVNINAAFPNNSKTPNYSAGSNKIACGNLTIESGSALQSTAGTLAIQGDWTNNNNGSGAEGGFTHNSGTVVFNGSSTQSIKGTALTRFYNLTLNNTNGVNLGAPSDANQRVDHTLKLSGNTRLTLGDNDLIMGGATAQPAIDQDGGSFSASKMIVADGNGSLCKHYNGSGSYSFPIGDVSGPSNTADYSPATLNFTSGTFASDAQACVRVVDAAHPNGDQTNYPTYITRYWPVTQSGISSFACTATFVYVEDDEVIGSGQSTAALYHWSYNSSTWTLHTQANTATNTLSSSVTNFSDHTARSGSPLAVALATFTADITPAGVTLSWETVSETDNAGFNIYRAEATLGSDDFSRPPGSSDFSRPTGPWTRLNPALIPAAAPGSSEGHSYTFTDATAAPGASYWYLLEDITLDGAATQHPPVQVTVGEPNAVGLTDLFVVTTSVVAPALAGLAALALAALAGAAMQRRHR